MQGRQRFQGVVVELLVWVPLRFALFLVSAPTITQIHALLSQARKQQIILSEVILQAAFLSSLPVELFLTFSHTTEIDLVKQNQVIPRKQVL